MRILKALSLSCCAAFLCAALSPSAKADDWNKKTTVTFNESVEVPGAILSPGTYVFKVVDLKGSRTVVQIMNQDEDYVYSTAQTVPIERSSPPDHVVLRFAERPSDSPEALSAWFYPGFETGNQFVYPASEYANDVERY